MVASARSGSNFDDPNEFYRSLAVSANLHNMNFGGTTAAASAAGFFTNQAIRGLADDTNWTANTYKQLLSISSGKGLVSNLIGPTGLAGTPTTTFEITVDGVLTEVPVMATTTGDRAILGAISPDGSGGTAFTAVKQMDEDADSIDAGKTTQRHLNALVGIWPWRTIRTFGTPCLIFRQSLLIRAKSSENNSTTTNQERQSAVQYMVMR